MFKFISTVSNIAVAIYIGQLVMDEFLPVLNQSIMLIQNLPFK